MEKPRTARVVLLLLGQSGREIAIRQPFFEDLPRYLTMQLNSVGLTIELVEAEIEPLQAVENGIDRRLGVAIDIRIIDVQHHRATITPRVEPVENEGSSAA